MESKKGFGSSTAFNGPLPFSSEVGKSAVREALENAEEVKFDGHHEYGETGGGARTNIKPSTEPYQDKPPLSPLGHGGGTYYFISPSGELRNMKAEALEAGRGVKALFLGMGDGVDRWCQANFASEKDGWCTKRAGRWIIKACNAKGVFNPSSADIRSIGVWRDDEFGAIAHCGDCFSASDGSCYPLVRSTRRHVLVGAPSIQPPDFEPSSKDTYRKLLAEVTKMWGWQNSAAPEVFLGWVAAAALGGFPKWRTHVYVYGNRGSGKSKLMELADCLLGDFAGGVINDATEAGIRQSRDNQARPLLIDEFEPENNPQATSQQQSILALFRRMSGGEGGRIARGGADHTAKSFRTLGAAYVTSINHIHLEPQDRSRFVFLELGLIPKSDNPTEAATELANLLARCRDHSAQFRGRMLAQSKYWDATRATISAQAQVFGADQRQADTIATVLAGIDLLLFDGEIDEARLEDLKDTIRSLICDASDSDEFSEGADALSYLLGTNLTLDRGFRRNVRELLQAAIEEETLEEGLDPKRSLGRYDIFVLPKLEAVALRVGNTCQVAKLFSETKWRSGAHKSALLKVDGVTAPENSLRVGPNQKHRVVLIPFEQIFG